MNAEYSKNANSKMASLMLCLSIFTFMPAVVQAETREVIAGPQYEKSGRYEFWYGKNWRDLWTTPIQVEVLDLNKEAGGLTVVRRVGGLQTPGLALKGADGKAYTFRSIDKDLSGLLPAEWRGTVVQERMQDQTSAQHPGAYQVVSGLAAAFPWAVLPPHRLVVMPDDPTLGKHRELFANKLGTFGEFPLPASDTQPGFLGATEILSTRELWSRWLEDPSARVNTDVLLRWRIGDLWSGDWDRHSKQWRWAKFPDQERWWPIPEDPDGAFANYQGVLISIARGMHPKLLAFKDKISPMEGASFNGADIDRWLLIDQDKEAFMSATREIQSGLTDEAIDDAVRQLPPQWYEISGPALAERLKKRRDNLEEAIERYYRHLMGQVSIQGTNRDESLHIRRFDDGAVEIALGLRDQGAEPYYRRRFEPDETKALRIYLHGGDDRVVSKGPAKNKIKVHVVGGPGDDTLDDSASGRTRFYDFEGENNVIKGKGTKVDTRPYENPLPEVDNPWREPRDFGRWTRLGATFWWTSDFGLLLGARVTSTNWSFRKFPYSGNQILHAEYSTKRSRGRIEYTGDFRGLNSSWSLDTRIRASGLEKLNFFGFGNDTPRVSTLDDQDFYRVRQNLLGFLPTLYWTNPSNDLRVAFGADLQNTDETSSGTLISQTQPYGSGDFSQLGLFVGLEWDSLGLKVPGASLAAFALPEPGAEDAETPRERRTGAEVSLVASWFPAVWDVIEDFGALEGEVSGTLGLGESERVVIGARLGGRKVWGTFPWFESAFIGGMDSNRGLRAQRYAGDRSLYGSVELRVHVFDATVVLPGRYWLFGLADAGRVWSDNDDSNDWHPSYGGGLVVELPASPIKLTAEVAKNDDEDDPRFYVSTGFTF